MSLIEDAEFGARPTAEGYGHYDCPNRQRDEDAGEDYSCRHVIHRSSPRAGCAGGAVGAPWLCGSTDPSNRSLRRRRQYYRDASQTEFTGFGIAYARRPVCPVSARGRVGVASGSRSKLFCTRYSIGGKIKNALMLMIASSIHEPKRSRFLNPIGSATFAVWDTHERRHIMDRFDESSSGSADS